MDSQRHLAAIVFTDIVGFSLLSQRNEASAMALLDKHNVVVREVVAKHGGREVKTIGDSFLLEFPSALQAVSFAVETQERLGRPGALDSNEGVSVRIGVHVGDVIDREGDLMGDAVNIASRIMSAATGGDVFVSRNVFDQVANKVPFVLERLPPQSLKNIEQAIELYRVALSRRQPSMPEGALVGNRIAVLPFSNISPDPNDSYFAEGLTEELISALSEVRGLRVIARTSVSHYKDTSKSADQIGLELKVAHLLEGSVRKSGNRLRITANLVDTRTQEELWSQKYDKDLTDAFSIQSGIAASVVDSLKVKLLRTEKSRIEGKETENIAAYVAYLKGRSLLRKGTEESAHQAQEQFELAIREDENYAKAYVGKADCVVLLGDYFFTSIPVALEEARKWVDKALSLDPNLAEAHASLAALLMYDYKFEEADMEFRRAIEANPSYATAHQWRSSCLQALGRYDEGILEVLQAEELDPLSSAITLSVIYRTRGVWTDEETQKKVRKLEQLDPESPLVDEARMVTAFARQDWERALYYNDLMMKKDPNDPYLDGNLAYIRGVQGNREEALRIIEKLKKDVPEDAGIKGQIIGFAYAGIGDFDEVFRWWNYGVQKKETFLGWTRTMPLFSKVRDDPRYSELLRSVGLPPY